MRSDADGPVALVPELLMTGRNVGRIPFVGEDLDAVLLVGEGLPNAEISDRLHLAPGTVRNYLSESIAKLGVSNRIEAARLARQRGWL